MKKSIFLMSIVCLSAISAFAQDNKPTDFSGIWTLDVSKSKLDERMRVESMTLNVKQTEKELTVENKIKRAERPEGEMPNGGMRGGGGRMGGGFGNGEGTTAYNLDGKETSAPVSAPGQAGGVATSKAEFDKGKLKTITIRNISSPMGEIKLTTKETWEILDGGKTLKIIRDMETPRGNRTSEMVFTKK
jgi:hypothetical protein